MFYFRIPFRCDILKWWRAKQKKCKYILKIIIMNWHDTTRHSYKLKCLPCNTKTDEKYVSLWIWQRSQSIIVFLASRIPSKIEQIIKIQRKRRVKLWCIHMKNKKFFFFKKYSQSKWNLDAINNHRCWIVVKTKWKKKWTIKITLFWESYK